MGNLEPVFAPSASADVTTLLARLSAARAGYLDNINNANLGTIPAISAAEIGHLDADISAVVQQIALTGHPGDSIGKILYDFYNTRLTATICGYLNNANLGTIDDISSLGATEIGYLTELAAANLPSDIDDIKAKTDNLPGTNADVSGNITWVTLTHTTNEGDISALFSTDLTGATRRRYAVFVDLTGCEADGAAWTTCTVRVKIGFGAASAYRTVDLKEIAKADVAVAKEPGVPIDVPATAKNVQITLQFDVALNANATIYYSYVNEALE